MPQYVIRTRREAARLGLKKYFTGEPCANGHMCRRYTNGAHCISCAREKYDAWVVANRDRAFELNKRWREDNPHRFKELCARWRRENPERLKALASKYNRKKQARKGVIARRILRDLARSNPALREIMREINDTA